MHILSTIKYVSKLNYAKSLNILLLFELHPYFVLQLTFQIFLYLSLKPSNLVLKFSFITSFHIILGLLKDPQLWGLTSSCMYIFI